MAEEPKTTEPLTDLPLNVQWDGGYLVFRINRHGLAFAEGEHIFKPARDIRPPGPLDLGELSGGAVTGKCIVKECEVDGYANATRIAFVSTGEVVIAS